MPLTLEPHGTEEGNSIIGKVVVRHTRSSPLWVCVKYVITQIWGTAITDPNGVFDSGTGPENVARRVIPDTPVDTVFHIFCDARPRPNPE